MSLIIKDISFSYGKKHIFNHYDLTINNGINVVLGANGSGKTTLFKMLAKINDPKSGTIFLNSNNYGTKDIRKYISYIPQSFNVYPSVKVKDFLEHIGNVKYGYNKGKMKNEIERVAKATDISDFLHEKMKNLSEGMRKRVGIAQAIIGDAALIIADEPTAGLDPEQRNKFNVILKRVASDKIILVSTHIIEDIRDYYDHIVTISKGKNTFEGSYFEFINSLNNRVVEMEVNLNDIEDIESKFHIINKDYREEKVIVRAIVDEVSEEMKMVEPSLTDIWSYYK